MSIPLPFRRALLISAAFTSVIAARSAAAEISLTDHYDSGISIPPKIEGNHVTFDFRGNVHTYLDSELSCSPRDLKITLWFNARATRFYAAQGVYVSPGSDEFGLRPLTKISEVKREVENAGKRETVVDTEFELTVTVGESGRVRICTSDPYGRDHLEQLVCETAKGAGHWRLIRRLNRPLLIFEIGADDGKKPIHYFIAGEDNRETESQWVADRMIRRLASEPETAAAATRHAVIRICPLLSPYTASARDHNSYTSVVDGRDMYGAAKWNLEPSPPEMELLKEMIVQTIRQKRLGLVLTMHGWWAGKAETEIETVKAAGAHVLTPERQAWAIRVMQGLMDGVPHAHIAMPDKAWFPGILREFTLSHYNAITFRVEVTSQDQKESRGAATAAAFLNNIGQPIDWRPALE